MTFRYTPLAESSKAIKRRLKNIGELGDPRQIGKVAWMRRTECGNEYGMILKVASDIEQNENYLHSAFPAFEDIGDFESKLIAIKGERGLIELTEQTPTILHRMGYFKSYGIRDMHLISIDGTAELRKPDNLLLSTEPYRVEPQDNDETITIRYVIQKTIERLLKETPDAYLFLHFLGKPPDLNAANNYVTPLREYLTVEQQINDGLHIPPGQRENMITLLADEMQLLENPILAYYEANAYPRETVDQARYKIFADGTLIGVSNKRAMKDMIRSILAEEPSVKVLVHKAGSQVNFNLFEELTHINVMDGAVTRHLPRQCAEGLDLTLTPCDK